MKRVVWISLLTALAGYFLYPGPQMREAERQREAKELRMAMERDAAERSRKRKENEAVILSADRETIDRLISDCRTKIGNLLSNNSPFAVHFPTYSPDDLKELGNLSIGFNKSLGRPSSAMSGGPTEWNADRIMNRDNPRLSISLAVEHARDGFSVRQYAAIYTCELDGLHVGDPSQEEFYFLD